MKKNIFAIVGILGLSALLLGATQYEQVKASGKPIVGNVTIVDADGNTGGAGSAVAETGYQFATSVTLTASTDWTRFSLSTTAGVASTFRGTFRYRIVNQGANLGFWYENNLHATPLFAGNAVGVSLTPIQVDAAAYDTVVHWRSDGTTTGVLSVWKR